VRSDDSASGSGTCARVLAVGLFVAACRGGPSKDLSDAGDAVGGPDNASVDVIGDMPRSCSDPICPEADRLQAYKREHILPSPTGASRVVYFALAPGCRVTMERNGEMRMVTLTASECTAFSCAILSPEVDDLLGNPGSCNGIGEGSMPIEVTKVGEALRKADLKDCHFDARFQCLSNAEQRVFDAYFN